jgi:hypothetical protein
MSHPWSTSAAGVLFGIVLFQLTGGAIAQQPSQGQANAIRQSCRSDYQSYCSSVPAGGSASLQCLQSHMSELSGACQTSVSGAIGGAASRPPPTGAEAMPPPGAPPMSPREKMAMMRRACGGDFRAYCRGVPLGGGEGMRCLAENQSRLSSACQSVLAEARGTR